MISQYSALYSLIGTRYGGNSTTFKVPDLRGRFPIGMGADSAYNVNYALGQVHNAGGSNGKITLNQNNVPVAAHSHAVTSNATFPSGGTSVPVNLEIKIPVNADTTGVTLTNVPTNNMLAVAKVGANAANIYTSSTPVASNNLKSFNVSSNITVPAPTATIASTCANNTVIPASQSVDIAPSYLCINYIMATEGLYPTRP